METVTTWSVSAYVESDMSMTSFVLPVMSLQFIIVFPAAPSKELIEALVAEHTRNCVLLMSEVSRNDIPSDLLPGN